MNKAAPKVEAINEQITQLEQLVVRASQNAGACDQLHEFLEKTRPSSQIIAAGIAKNETRRMGYYFPVTEAMLRAFLQVQLARERMNEVVKKFAAAANWIAWSAMIVTVVVGLVALMYAIT